MQERPSFLVGLTATLCLAMVALSSAPRTIGSKIFIVVVVVVISQGRGILDSVWGALTCASEWYLVLDAIN